jgi:hypothetical protein
MEGDHLLPAGEPTQPRAGAFAGQPSQKAQSWGVVISIIVIVLMIITGALYAWGERIAQNKVFLDAAASQSDTTQN